MLRDCTCAALAALAVLVPTPESYASPSRPDTSPSVAADPDRGSGVETVAITTQDGLKLSASLYLPSRKHNRAPTVLVAHAPGSDRKHVGRIGEVLRKEGFAVLTVDLRGHGDSSTDKGWMELGRPEQEQTWAFALRDLQAAASFLHGRHDIQATNMTVVGVGSGCGLALRHASGDENARAAVLIAPTDDQLGFDLPQELQRCGGMPTLVIASRDGRARAKRLVDGLQSSGHPEVEFAALRSGEEEVLSDEKTAERIATYLGRTVVEHKGR